MQWFPFQGVMVHTSNHINSMSENLQLLSKLFSIFKIRIWYYETIVAENVLDAVGITWINCGKTIGCSLENKKIEDFITTFVTNMVFQNVGLSCIIQSNQELSFYFQHHCPSWILNGPWYNTTIFSLLHGSSFKDYVTTSIKYIYNLTY